MQTGSLFQSSCLHLMTLESSIIQLDYHQGYLLVSTLTHSYVCNTFSETFTQVGTKPRQGKYGGCFCQIKQSDNFPYREAIQVDVQTSLTSSSEKFGLSDCHEAIEEEEETHNSSVLRRERITSQMPMSHVFCARPGTRIWEADHCGKVLVTHQLKSALMISPAVVLLIDGTYSEQNLLEEIRFLQETEIGYPVNRTRNKLDGEESGRNNIQVKTSYHPASVAFTKILNFYNKYLLAISIYGLYLIDPATTKVLLWVSISEGIADIKLSGNSIIYKSGNGSIQNIMITTVDIAILFLHTRKLFLECASLCFKNADAFVESEVLSPLWAKILIDLNDNITSTIIKERIKGLKYFVTMEKKRNRNMVSTKTSGVTYIKNKSFESEEVKATLNVALKTNSPALSNMIIMRWSSDPYLGESQKEWKQLPSARATMSLENNPKWHNRKNISGVKTVVRLYEPSHHPTNADSQSSRFSCTVHTGPVHNMENNTSPSSDPCSQQFDDFSLQKNQESSIMFENPSFTPEDSPSDHEVASRFFLNKHLPQTVPYISHNFSNIAYAPIRPGSEAATLLQDLMENVTTNISVNFTTGTHTLTKQLKRVVPLLSYNIGTGEIVSTDEVKRYSNTDLQHIHLVSPEEDSVCNDDFPVATVIQARPTKKISQKSVSIIAPDGGSHVDLEETVPRPEFPGVVRNLHELVCITMQQPHNTNNSEDKQDFLCHWFEVFCHTILEIHHDGMQSSLPTREDEIRDGSISLPSFESPHSMGSADTSSDSLHWDSNDIGFEPSSLNDDFLEKISHLFLESVKAGVTASIIHHPKLMSQKIDLPQHPMTPPEIRRRDAFYARVIASDCGLLHYSNLLNSLEYFGQHYYILIWVALMKKITRNSNILFSQQLPDIIPDIELTRAQRVAILHNVASSTNTKTLTTVAAQIKSSSLILDIVFLLQYMTTQPTEIKYSLDESQIPKVLLQYLIEFSHHNDLANAYLDCWCLYSELQSDILMALLSKTSPDPSHFSCKCGLPLPHRRPVSLELLEEIMLLHDIVDPRNLAKLCQDLSYWRGYCSISLAYCLQPYSKLFPYILQTCNANLISNFFDILHDDDDLRMAFTTLARVSSEDIYTMLCFRCQTKITFPEKIKVMENSRYKHNFSTIGNSYLSDNTLSESCLSEKINKNLTDNHPFIQEPIAIENMTQLWEMVIAKVLPRSGASNTLRLLAYIQDTVPRGVLSRRVFNWYILASLAEQRGHAAASALLDSVCCNKTKIYSQKVLEAIHHRSLQKSNENQACDVSSKWLRRGRPFPDTTQNIFSPSHTNIKSKNQRYFLGVDHHWGLWVKMLEGVCSCCHLRLSTQALVSEGGITVFFCGHAFHTICLFHREHHCVLCAQR